MISARPANSRMEICMLSSPFLDLSLGQLIMITIYHIESENVMLTLELNKPAAYFINGCTSGRKPAYEAWAAKINHYSYQ